MQFFKNPTARAIAEAISRREIVNAAFAAGIAPEDAEFVFFDFLQAIEKGESSFSAEKGDPVRWARASLKWHFFERREKNHLPFFEFGDFGDFDEPFAVSKASFEDWRFADREFDFPSAGSIAAIHGFSAKNALRVFRRGIREIEERKNSGENLDALAVFLDPAHPIWARKRARKGGAK